MKWSEIKSETYELMFLDAWQREDYEDMIVNAANYALVDLSESISPIVVCDEVILSNNKNLLSRKQRKELYVIRKNSPVNFEVNDLGSIAFMYSGGGQMRIDYDNSAAVIPLAEVSVMNSYSYTMPYNSHAKITFSTDNRLIIKNLGLYSESEGEIIPYEKYTRIDLDEISDGAFLRLSEKGAVFDVQTGDVLTDWFCPGGNEIYVPTDYEGVIAVSYIKCPTLITNITPGSTELELSIEAAKLMPLYCAWRLLKDDNERLAAIYFNEYTDKKSDIMARNSRNDSVKFTVWSERGYL